MIDLHSHILPAIDDGSKNIPQSLKMANIAVKDGIKQIVATPHITNDQGFKQTIVNRCKELNQALKDKNIPLEIKTGDEIPLFLNLEAIHQFTMNCQRYVLIELPFDYVPVTTKEYLRQLQYNNFWPIIAHPERNNMIIENPTILFDLLENNVGIQVTSGSLVGMFGNDAKQCARFLIKKGVVTILAPDAHDHEYRPPIMSKGLKVASKLIGKTEANKLVNENPLAIMNGEKLNG